MKHHQLENFLNQTSIEPLPKSGAAREKISQKEIDIFCRDLLTRYPELKEKIVKQMHSLEKQKLPLPVIHITSRAISGENNSETNTGFVENIEKNGFRQRDTNVAAFMKREEKTCLAQPDYYSARPEEFIKSLRLFLKRYLHHGYRTNKNALGDVKDTGQGIPIMIIVAGGAPLERASDYDDHYLLKNNVAPDQIMGKIDLAKHNYYRSQDDVLYLAEEILKQTNSFYEATKN